jgi:hypothetical protein
MVFTNSAEACGPMPPSTPHISVELILLSIDIPVRQRAGSGLSGLIVLVSGCADSESIENGGVTWPEPAA